MPKFTPGPYLIRHAGTGTALWLEVYVKGDYFDDGSEFVVAELGITHTRQSSEKRWQRTADAAIHEANARLIASSWEMYEAMKNLLETHCCDSGEADYTPEWDGEHTVCADCKPCYAALAKADGEAVSA